MERVRLTDGRNEAYLEGDLVFITISQGKIAIVDYADWNKVKLKRWSAAQTNKNRYSCYVACNEGKKKLHLHAYLLNPPDGLIVDHINGDGLNNSRKNLRLATYSQNRVNQSRFKKHKKLHSRYLGVFKNRGSNSWCARCCGKYLGSFKNEVDAAKAFNNYAKVKFGEFATLNVIEEEKEQGT